MEKLSEATSCSLEEEEEENKPVFHANERSPPKWPLAAAAPSNVDPGPLHPHSSPPFPTAVCCLTHPPRKTQGFLAAWAQRGTLSLKQVE